MASYYFMKNHRIRICRNLALLALLLAFAGKLAAQTIFNPSFESNSFSVYPGYSAANGAIPGWTCLYAAYAGLNPADGNPFADNGTVPDGNNVAFIQTAGGITNWLATTISNLTVGATYRVTCRINSRVETATPTMWLSLNGATVNTFTATPMHPLNVAGPYGFAYGIFTATNTTAALVVSSYSATDGSLLLDNFAVAALPTNYFTASPWTNDLSTGVGPGTVYAYAFGLAANVTINGVTFIGTNASSQAAGGQFSITGETYAYANETPDNLSGAGSIAMAASFYYGGNPATVTLSNLVAGASYRLSFFGVGFDIPGNRYASFAGGGDQLMLDEDQYGQGNGIRVDYNFTASSATTVVTLTPLVANNTFHMHGLALTMLAPPANYVAANPVVTLVSSGLSSPYGVAVDGAGNVYIADSGDNEIKKWSAANNTVNTLVSLGVSSPFGVAADGAGNVYIADSGDNEIEKWSAANDTMATLVPLGLNHPYGVALDSAGNVYIADTFNNAIKEWTAANNTVTTLVSSGLNEPSGVAVDGAGNVYIADSGNNAIKEWMAANDTVTPLVSSGLNYPFGVAVDGAGNVYIADSGSSAVKEWTATNNTVTKLVSGLNQPYGVAVDGAGNVYIADSGNNAIKERPRAFVNPTARAESAFAGGDVLPVVLPATQNLTGPFAPTSDSAWLTLSGVTNGVVSFNFTANTNASSRTGNITLLGQTIPVTQAAIYTLGTTHLLEGPSAGADSVALVTSDAWTNSTTTSWLHLSAATQIGIGSTNIVFTFDANPGATRTGTLTIAGLTVTVTQAGPVYSLGATMLLEGPTAGSASVALSANTAWSASPNATWLCLSAANQIGIGSTDVVFTFDANPGATRTGTLTIVGQTVTVSQAGATYVPANPVTTLVSSGLNYPGSVAVDGAGNVYIADTLNNAIKKWTAANNTVTTLVSSGLNTPAGVAVDGAGNVYIADTFNSAIKEWTAANQTVTTLVPSGLNYPYGVAVDGGGNVYIADSENSALKEWMAANNTLTTLVSSGLAAPRGVAMDGAGNIYIADLGNNAIKELPWAFVDPTAKTELAFAGGDVLPVVLPATQNLTGPFAPTSDSAWLTLPVVTNGVVSFNFTANTSTGSRTGNITLLGQTIPVTQAAAVTPPSISGANILVSGAFQMSFNSTTGVGFTVLSSTNLALPVAQWTVLGAAVETPAGSGQYQFTDPSATNQARYYLVRTP
jgi:DNA-binding beta-propeller fold protein YncE